MQTRTLIMVETALMVALALILDRIEFAGPWVMGGSISLVMLPIFVMAFRRGLKVG
nr:energy-coupled thiamine transporter ThiT [Geomicrobium sp. JCM 19039]